MGRRRMCGRLSPVIVLVAAAIAALSPSPAAAQASRLGPTLVVASGAIRYADAAYDPVNDVYLVTGGAGAIVGRFVTGEGALLGPPVVLHETRIYTMVSRTIYCPDLGGFLVVWLDLRSDPRRAQIWGRLLKYDNGSVSFLSGDFMIALASGGAHSESGPALSYSTASREFLVVWQQGGGGGTVYDIRGQRLSLTGTPIGGEIPITADRHWQERPAADYDPRTNSWFVIWQQAFDPNGPAAAIGRRVSAGSGALGEMVTLFTAADVYVTDVTYQPGTGRYLASWFASSVHYGTFIDAEGARLTPIVPLVSRSTSYGGWDVAHSATADAFMAVFQGASTYEAQAVLIQPSGTPGSIFDATAGGATNGTFNPRITAGRAKPEWLVAAQSDARIAAQRLSVTGCCGGGGPGPVDPGPIQTLPDPTAIDVTGAPNGSEYFAEGMASSNALGFNTYYQISNANDVAVSVRAYFAKESTNGEVTLRARLISVPANGRRTVDLKTLVGDGPWSAVFQSITPGAPVTTQQSLFWGQNLEGSSSETAAQSAAPLWMFAEGTRRANDYFNNYFLLFNPGAQPITVLGEYFGQGSATPVTLPYNLPPSSRLTIYANDQVPSLANADFSVRFRAVDGTSPFVAQRAMYWRNFVGGHLANGTTASHPTWLFAEGSAAPNFDTYFTLLNPNAFPVDVDVTYLTEAAGPRARGQALRIPANSRETIWANGELGNIGAFGTTFNTVGGHGIVVERSIYWGAGGFPNWVEGTNDAGVNQPAMAWSVPEGSDTGTFDTYLLVANPNDFAVDVRVQFYRDGGGRLTVEPPVRVPARSRLTIDMSNPGATFPALNNPEGLSWFRGQSFATWLTSLTTNGPIIVEGATYRQMDGANYWRAGASAFGIPK